jgi:hypothetical protein
MRRIGVDDRGGRLAPARAEQPQRDNSQRLVLRGRIDVALRGQPCVPASGGISSGANRGIILSRFAM